MFDISGWFEVLLIVIVALIILGPKEIPTLLKFIGKWVYRLRSLSRELKSQIDELVYEAEREEIKSRNKKDFNEEIKD